MNQLNEINIAGVVEAIEEAYTKHNKITEKDEKFYTITLQVPRLSDTCDKVPVVAPEKLVQHIDAKIGDKIAVLGTMRTRSYDEGKNHHVSIYAYADDLFALSDEEYDDIPSRNVVRVEGVVCKTPNYRTTKSGRIITDLIVANNRMCYRKAIGKKRGHMIRKSSYFPCIVWGNNAKAAKHLQVGDVISLTGRFQSRVYRRKTDTFETHTAYEISILDYTVETNEENTEDNSIEVIQ